MMDNKYWGNRTREISHEQLVDEYLQSELIIDDVVANSIAKHMKAKSPVIVYRNNEAGPFQWSITPVEEIGLWLNSFKRKKDVIRFCNIFQLPIERLIKEVLERY